MITDEIITDEIITDEIITDEILCSILHVLLLIHSFSRLIHSLRRKEKN